MGTPFPIVVATMGSGSRVPYNLQKMNIHAEIYIFSNSLDINGSQTLGDQYVSSVRISKYFELVHPLVVLAPIYRTDTFYSQCTVHDRLKFDCFINCYFIRF